MLRDLLRWARITKAGDDDKDFAVQQMEYLGKAAQDGIIVFPYGIHGNVPPDSLALMFAVQGHASNRAAIAWTPKDRPTLVEGEVAFYHPPTEGIAKWCENGDLQVETKGENGSKIVTIKKDWIEAVGGDIEITADGEADMTATKINLDASDSLNVDSPLTNLGVGGEKIARLGDEVTVTVTGGSSAGTYTGTITTAGDNTSI